MRIQQILALVVSCTVLQGAVTRITVCDSGCDYANTRVGLQSAVDAARSANTTDPVVIEVAANDENTGDDPVLLRGKCNGASNPDSGCTQAAPEKMKIIRSSNMAALPAGTRVLPADVAKLAKITLTGSNPGVFICMPETTDNPSNTPCNHWLLQGLEIYSHPVNAGTSAVGANYGGIVNIGLSNDGSTKARQPWQAPYNITVDRCYLHGLDGATWVTTNSPEMTAQGVRADGRIIAVIDSYLQDLNRDGVDWGHGETVGVFESNGQGPLLIRNSRVVGAINSLAGGEAPWIPGLINVGYVSQGNEYTHEAISGRWVDFNAPGLDTSQACVTNSWYDERFGSNNQYKCVAGAWALQGTTIPGNTNWTKNGWECKNCRLALAEGDYIHQIFDGSWQSQHGHAFLINNVDPDPGNANCTYCRPEYITLRFNRADKVGQGVVFGRLGTPIVETNHVRVEHNIITGVGDPTVAPLNAPLGGSQYEMGLQDAITLRHDTMLFAKTAGGVHMRECPGCTVPPTHMANFTYQDSIGSWASLGFHGEVSTDSCAGFLAQIGGTVNWDHIGLIDSNSRGSSAFTAAYGSAPCPATLSYAATNTDVFNSPGTGDYSVKNTHAWFTAGSDGGPLGADVTQVNYATQGAATGADNRAYFEFQIRSTEKTSARWTSYDTTQCSYTIKSVTGSTEASGNDTAGSNRERTVSFTALATGQHTLRVTCASRWKEQEFRTW